MYLKLENLQCFSNSGCMDARQNRFFSYNCSLCAKATRDTNLCSQEEQFSKDSSLTPSFFLSFSFVFVSSALFLNWNASHKRDMCWQCVLPRHLGLTWMISRCMLCNVFAEAGFVSRCVFRRWHQTLPDDSSTRKQSARWNELQYMNFFSPEFSLLIAQLFAYFHQTTGLCLWSVCMIYKSEKIITSANGQYFECDLLSRETSPMVVKRPMDLRKKTFPSLAANIY